MDTNSSLSGNRAAWQPGILRQNCSPSLRLYNGPSAYPTDSSWHTQEPHEGLESVPRAHPCQLPQREDKRKEVPTLYGEEPG